MVCLKCFIVLLSIFLYLNIIDNVEGGRNLEVVYEWNSLDYTWAAPDVRRKYLENERFIPQNNIIAGVKVYKNQVFVTVPRWLPGVPSTLNKVVMKNKRPLLQPFPAWNWQLIDRCDALQFTQSMEIDPIQGHMWIIDAGRRDIWLEGRSVNKCPPKLMIYDLENEMFIHKYIFPPDVASYDQSFLNDIVVDFDEGYAYITDAGNGPNSGAPGAIIVYDKQTGSSHRVEHPTMKPEKDNKMINIEGKNYDFFVPVDGIALSPDGEHLFYTPLTGLNLYQVPTDAVRKYKKLSSQSQLPVRDLGPKPSQTDGMVMGHERLYFGSLSLNMVHVWEYKKDMASQKKTLDEVGMASVHPLLDDEKSLIWPDGFDLDEDGYLWIAVNQLPKFLRRELDIQSNWEGHANVGSSNFQLCKVYVGDIGYKTKIAGWSGVLWFYGIMLVLSVAVFFLLGVTDNNQPKPKKN